MTEKCIGDLIASVTSVCPATGRIPTGYVVRVEVAGEKWYICRRYSEFRAFWERLIHLLNNGCMCPDRSHFLKGLELDSFPKKHTVKSFCMNQKVVSERLESLNKLLERMTLRLRTCSRSSLKECEAKNCQLQELISKFFAFPSSEITSSIPAVVMEGNGKSSFSDWREFHRKIVRSDKDRAKIPQHHRYSSADAARDAIFHPTSNAIARNFDSDVFRVKLHDQSVNPSSIAKSKNRVRGRSVNGLLDIGYLKCYSPQSYLDRRTVQNESPSDIGLIEFSLDHEQIPRRSSSFSSHHAKSSEHFLTFDLSAPSTTASA